MNPTQHSHNLNRVFILCVNTITIFGAHVYKSSHFKLDNEILVQCDLCLFNLPSWKRYSTAYTQQLCLGYNIVGVIHSRPGKKNRARTLWMHTLF